MGIREKYQLTRVLNARGSYTPLGVSRSSPMVAHAAAEALSEFFLIDELQATVSAAISRATGAEAACVTHCVAAAITVSVAAAMAGDDEAKLSALPVTDGLANRVVISAGHAVDYGHPLLTDIRLAGATPVLAGTESACSIEQLDLALSGDRVACLLLVASRLVRGQAVDLAEAVAAAHRHGVPVIIDAAAQDMQMSRLLASGADLVLISAHKYLASPTAGLIIGQSSWVRACRAQERGIGRAMKASKEAMLGVLAVLEEREALDMGEWRAEQDQKLRRFMDRIDAIAGLSACELPDPVGMPFSRVAIEVSPDHRLRSAAMLASALRQAEPPILVMEHAVSDGLLILELVALRSDELREIHDRLVELSTPSTDRGPD